MFLKEKNHEISVIFARFLLQQIYLPNDLKGYGFPNTVIV
jgi:hypothetical protein